MSRPETVSGPSPPPARFAFDAVTWKEIAYLLANPPVDVIGFVYVAVMIPLSVGLSLTVVGLPLLAMVLAGARLLGMLERGRARGMLRVVVEEPRPLRPGTFGFPP